MILRILRANHFYNFLLVAIVGFMLILGSLIQGGVFPGQDCEFTSPLCHPIMTSGISYATALIINYALILVICFLLLQINAEFDFVKERTFLPAFLFLFMVLGFPELHLLNPVYFSGIFTILAIRSIFNSFEKRMAIRNAFNSGFFIGLAGIFYLPATMFIIIIPIALLIIRNKVQWREVIVPFVGLALPWMLLFSGYYVFDDPQNLLTLINNSLIPQKKTYLTQLPIQIFLGYLGILIAISSVFILNQYGVKNINVRRYFKVLFIFFSSACFILILPNVAIEGLIFITIPVTFLLTNYLIFVKRRFWAELFLTLLIVSSIVIQFFI